MFQRLARSNQDLYADLTIAMQERAFTEHFRITERCELDGIPRTLYVMEKW